MLRLRSDDQLVALFRAGSDDAFRAIHDRYRVRLLAYARQMLRGGSGDPEDALQDVFLRAYRSLRSSERPVILRAWLYRIAHNRCIDELRRPHPVPSEIDGDAESAFAAPRATGEPAAVMERGAALTRLLADVQSLPGQQRSALLMRELQGLSYEELASALAVSVPAVKSLLLRARTGLVDIAVARDTPCADIRDELLRAADRSVRISGRARRHCSECEPCEAYRGELRRVRRGFAALTPSSPLGHLGMLLGLGGGGGAAAAGGGGAAVGGSALAGATAAKIAVAVCCAALIGTAGPAVLAPSKRPAATGPPPPIAHAALAVPAAPLPSSASAPAGSGSVSGRATIVVTHRLARAPAPAPPRGRPFVALPPAVPAGATGSIGISGGTGTTGAGAPGGGAAIGGSGLGGPGVTGATGATGGTGATTGATGTTGSSGSSGATGSSGGADVSGVSGASGSALGASGASGASGATGVTGATTPIGISGSGATNTPGIGGAGAPAGTLASGQGPMYDAPAMPGNGGTAGPTS